MSLIVKEMGGGREFKPVPAGTHVAVCTMIVDLGLQPGFENGPPQRKVYVGWEIPSEQIEWTDKDGNKQTGPMKIGRQYTLSLNEKATLRHHLENWRGRAFTAQELAGFDLFNIANKACLIGVTHKTTGDKTYANVSSVMSLPKGTTAPPASARVMLYPDPADKEAYSRLPEWLQKKIESQIEAKPVTAPAPMQGTATGTDDEFGDSIPF